MTFAAGFLLLIWVAGSILLNGVAVLHYFTRLRGLELLGYGAAAGVLWHGLLGCGIAALPGLRWVFVATLFGVTLASGVCLIARRVPQELSLALSRSSKVALALWAMLLVASIGLLHVQVRFPESLPDGLYIFKTPTTNVKLQYLVGLPADNYIPFAVVEYFLRGVSFEKERPILPGNEVTNRTILMSLVALPFRVALGAPRDHPQLGTYSYLDRDWPDVSKLDKDGSYEQFAIIAFVLNSLLLIGLLIFCSSLGANSILPLGALLYVTNPYFLAQTIFTWPKALAGFFILLAWTSLRRGHGPVFVAVLMALAYHSHPYALVFAGCIGLFYLTQWRWEKSRVPSAISYLLVFALLVVPWLVWTRLIVQIPSNLIAQNFAGPGTEAAWASPVNFLWVRFYNLVYLVSPTMFSIYPFEFGTVLNQWLYCAPGIIGLVLIYPALARCAELPRPRPWLWYGLLGPAFLILAIYSCLAFPVLHGYQPLLGTLLFFGVWWLSQHCRRAVFLGLVSLQLLLNLALVLARGFITGVRF